jgi:hypothetical protein
LYNFFDDIAAKILIKYLQTKFNNRLKKFRHSQDVAHAFYPSYSGSSWRQVDHNLKPAWAKI